MERLKKERLKVYLKIAGIFTILLVLIWIDEARSCGLPPMMEEGLAVECWENISNIKDKKEMEEKIVSEITFYALERKRLYFGADTIEEVSLHPLELGLSARKLINLLYNPRDKDYKKFKNHWRVIKKIASQ
jgi:hypothetical protein